MDNVIYIEDYLERKFLKIMEDVENYMDDDDVSANAMEIRKDIDRERQALRLD